VTATNAVAPPRRRRSGAFVATAVLVALVLAVGALELALRVLGGPVAMAGEWPPGMFVPTADDVALQPGFAGALPRDASVPVAIDALGMRCEPGDGSVRAKGTGEVRVLVLGDETVWGHGIAAAQAVPARLQARLRAGGRTVTVGNGGVPGHGSRHLVPHLARLDAPFGPDAIVVCGSLRDDALDDVRPQRTVFAGWLLHGAWARLVQHSWRARLMFRSRTALLAERWLASLAPEWSLERRLRPDPVEDALAGGFEPRLLRGGLFLDATDERHHTVPDMPPVIPRHVATLRQSLDALREAVGGRPLVFVVLPTRYQVEEPLRVAELRARGLPPERFERGRAQQRWLAAATAAGAVAADATPILAGEPDLDAVFRPDGMYLTVHGHDVVAAWLATVVAPLLPVR
jgi:hypothetical protein